MQRGYPEELIDSKMGKVVLSKEKVLRNKKIEGLLLVVAYHPLLRRNYSKIPLPFAYESLI